MHRKPWPLAHRDPKASPGPARSLPTGAAASALLAALLVSALAFASRADAAATVSGSGSTLTVSAGFGATDNLAITRPSALTLRVTDLPREGAGYATGVAVDSGHVYWADVGGTGIGRANLDGTHPDQGFIPGPWQSVAVDSGHIYSAYGGAWPSSPGAIVRANLDGTSVQGLITGGDPQGVAVDAHHVYWANYGGTIGRANLDGTSVNQSFIRTGGAAYGVAVNSNHVYWTSDDCTSHCYSRIGRANLDGSGVDRRFITGTGCCLWGIAVDSAHVYWTNYETGAIGRADLDGTGVDQPLITGAAHSEGVAVDANHVYWTNVTTSTIGRANLNGTGVKLSFIGPAYTGSVLHAGAGCTQSGDHAADCDATGITLIDASGGGLADRVVNWTAVPSSLSGGADDDLLIGGSAKDTLTGEAGPDVMKGMGGNDMLSARDLRSDTAIDCGAGTDKADLDLLPKDSDSVVKGCESKTRH